MFPHRNIHKKKYTSTKVVINAFMQASPLMFLRSASFYQVCYLTTLSTAKVIQRQYKIDKSMIWSTAGMILSVKDKLLLKKTVPAPLCPP
jgi:hypothetical protein